ncbi:hypothetical protein [Flavobacterium sp. RSP15]|uniref:hypothetical protein n=1 Tax=Flavobacterium sp. RSP15 TaxID=2497485 RepID=UPI000F82D281|nr:hypothetical protein [Flavobacterium sp. RSP15]RTY86946.1 hypothetical protein EKM00_08845 [Flavobacterium sp. RSP15]
MTTKIKIGADELILWLRKNEKAVNIPNDEIQGLGIKIHNLIVKEFGGIKVAENYPSYWANLMEDKNVEKFNLPKASAQYEIETQKIGQLYENLSRW